jgi:PadR family transcriptional regulator, regulatory protein PadR
MPLFMRKELVAASAEPLILSLLSKGESYGYAIIQDIKERSGDEIQWTDGMLYPVLHRMERNGWIKSRWVEVESGRKRKYYSIKQDGKKALAAQYGEWMAVHRVLTSYGATPHV